jgi:hypothetical protein
MNENIKEKLAEWHSLSPEEQRAIKEQKLQDVLDGIHPKQVTYIQTLPVSRKALFADAFSGSKAKAIKAKCLSCCNMEAEEVSNCTVITCPLYSVRPYQRNQEESEE